MNQQYFTWDGKEEVKVTYSRTRISDKWGFAEANVKRTFTPSQELHAAIFSQDHGRFNDKTAPNMTLRQRTTWLHLWDGVCCRTISPMEAWDCVKAGVVFEDLTVRASNYMHLL